MSRPSVSSLLDSWKDSSVPIKRIEDLTVEEYEGAVYCARVRCVDCVGGCQPVRQLMWDDWSRFANAIYHVERDERNAKRFSSR